MLLCYGGLPMTRAEAGRKGYEKSRDKLIIITRARHEEAVKAYLENSKKCNYCGKPLPFDKKDNKYCSHTCAGFALNERLGHAKSEKQRETCAWCNKTITGSGKKFCSIECSSAFRSNDKLKKALAYIKKTGEFPVFKTGSASGEVIRKTARAVLAELYGDKCSICGTSTWTGKKLTLIVDHIDGNPFNNKIENYRLVCPNCDSLLPTYKGRNKGRGRTLTRRLLSTKTNQQ